MKRALFSRIAWLPLLALGLVSSAGLASPSHSPQRPSLGEASGGGIPTRPLVDCRDSIYIGEGMKMSGSVVDKRLTAQPVYGPVTYTPSGDKAHFAGRSAAGAEFHLYVETEPRDGVFHGTLSLGASAVPVACQMLHDRFRPMPDVAYDVELYFGGTKCAPKDPTPPPPGTGVINCVGMIGGLTPVSDRVTLRFNSTYGRLEGSSVIERDVFGAIVIFETRLEKARGKALTQTFRILRKIDPNPTEVSIRGLAEEINVKTPALPLDRNTLQVWERVRVLEVH